MFRKLVAIEPVSLIPSAEKALHSLQKKVVMFLMFRQGMMK